MEPEKQSEPAPLQPQREVCLGRVQLKIVEASLTVLREIGKDLEITSVAVDRHCSVRFYNGQCRDFGMKLPYPLLSFHYLNLTSSLPLSSPPSLWTSLCGPPSVALPPSLR